MDRIVYRPRKKPAKPKKELPARESLVNVSPTSVRISRRELRFEMSCRVAAKFANTKLPLPCRSSRRQPRSRLQLNLPAFSLTCQYKHEIALDFLRSRIVGVSA